MTVVEFCRATRELLKNRKKHLSVEYVLDGLSSYSAVLSGCTVVVRERKFFRSNDEFNPDLEHLLFKHPSFRITCDGIERFQNHDDLVEVYKASNEIILEGRNVLITTDGNFDRSKMTEISEVLELIEDLYVQNIYSDIVAASAKKFVILASEKHPNLSLEQLLKYLCSEYDEAYGVSLLTYNYLEAGEGRNYLDETQMQLSEVVNFGHDLSEISDELSDTIKYCSFSGRLSDGFYPSEDGTETHYAVVPTGMDHDNLEDSVRSRDFVVIFSENEELDEFLVRFLEIGVARIEQRGKSERQATIIGRLASLKRELQAQIRGGFLRSEADRNQFVAPILESICEEIREHVSAHSLTVRTYNPFAEKLELYIEVCDTDARYKEGVARDIPISNSDSINVECFKTKNPEEHIYIRNLRPAKSGHSAERRYNPRSSRCEACFPIWKSGVPHGTMNVETSTVNSLSPYIQFLKWISMLISEISTEVSNALSSDVMDQISTINDLAHGTLDVDTGILDNLLKGTTATERKVVEAWRNYSASYRRPKSEIEAWEEEIVDLHKLATFELDRAVRAVPYFRYRGGEVYIPQPIGVSHIEARNISGVLRALISNAVKHAGFEEGSLRIFGLYRANRAFLFIRYATHEAIVPCNIVKDYGTCPVVKNGEVRYGGFLLAERVRAADGSFYVERPGSGAEKFCPLRISIAIPINGPWER